MCVLCSKEKQIVDRWKFKDSPIKKDSDKFFKAADDVTGCKNIDLVLNSYKTKGLMIELWESHNHKYPTIRNQPITKTDSFKFTAMHLIQAGLEYKHHHPDGLGLKLYFLRQIKS